VNTTQVGKFLGATLTFVFVAMGYGPGLLSGQQSLDFAVTLVTATPTCTATVDAVDFGTLEAGTTNGLGIGNAQDFNLNFNCTSALAAATASFDPGLNPTGSQRFVAEAGGATIRYNFERVSNSNLINHDETITFPVPSGSSTLALRAWLWDMQTLPNTLGAYTDQVMVTFTF